MVITFMTYLIYLLALALGIWAVKLLLDMLEIPQPIRTIVLVIIALALLLLVLQFLGGFPWV
jgi:hypothetical protein